MKKAAALVAMLSLIFFSAAAFAAKAKKTRSGASTANTAAATDAGSNIDQAAAIEQLKKEVAALKEASDKSKSDTSGFDHGFFIKSRDDAYSFKFRFFAQIYYDFQHNDDSQSINSFGIRRARTMFSGNVFSPNLSYMIMTEMVTQYASATTNTSTAYTVVDSGGDVSHFTVDDSFTDTNDRNFRLLYLWAQYKIADEFQIRVGEFIPPTEFFFRASNLLMFGDFPVIAVREPFTPNFQTGIDFLGTIAKKLDYELFAVNGTNLDRPNINKDFRLGLSLTYNILGRPGLGVSDVDYSQKPQLALTFAGAYERPDFTLNGVINIAKGDEAVRGQTNAVFRYKGFSLVPEFIVFYNATKHYRHYAAAAQAGYFILPKKLEVAAQANWLRFAGPRNDNIEYSAGLNYYFFGQPVKLMLDYSYLINKTPTGDQKAQRVRLTTQVGFF